MRALVDETAEGANTSLSLTHGAASTETIRTLATGAAVARELVTSDAGWAHCVCICERLSALHENKTSRARWQCACREVCALAR